MLDKSSYVPLATKKGGSAKMKKTGGGQPVNLEPTEIAVLNTYKGTVKMTGIAGVSETGTMTNYYFYGTLVNSNEFFTSRINKCIQ